jgi:hypothetical protein
VTQVQFKFTSDVLAGDQLTLLNFTGRKVVSEIYRYEIAPKVPRSIDIDQGDALDSSNELKSMLSLFTWVTRLNCCWRTTNMYASGSLSDNSNSVPGSYLKAISFTAEFISTSTIYSKSWERHSRKHKKKCRSNLSSNRLASSLFFFDSFLTSEFSC